jgi:hypothetical protein
MGMSDYEIWLKGVRKLWQAEDMPLDFFWDHLLSMGLDPVSDFKSGTSPENFVKKIQDEQI